MREHQVRRCIVCKRCSEKEELLRFVSGDAGLVWDKTHRLPGRGAYVHRTLSCWGKMLERNRWEHSFRGKVKVTDEILRSLQEETRGDVPELQVAEPAAPGRSSRRRVRF